MDEFACGTETRGLEEGFPRLCLLSGGGGGGGGGGGVGGVGGALLDVGVDLYGCCSVVASLI